jgi:hypothetical protein
MDLVVRRRSGVDSKCGGGGGDVEVESDGMGVLVLGSLKEGSVSQRLEIGRPVGSSPPNTGLRGGL